MHPCRRKRNENRIEGYHGAQVGVATVVTASLYEYLRSLSPASFDLDSLMPARPPASDEKKAIESRLDHSEQRQQQKHS